MDTPMSIEESPSLQSYVHSYAGHQRFTRLLSIIERAKLTDPLFAQAIDMGYDLALRERALGMFHRIQSTVSARYKGVGQQAPAS